MPTSIGKGEGQLNLIAWEGYAQPQWVKPFEKQTGCQVNAKYAGSSSEMVSLMANGGGGQYDLVSASGDADLRLIYGGDVRPINIVADPVLEGASSRSCSRRRSTRSAASTTASRSSSAPTCCSTRRRCSRRAPTSWSVLYNKKYKGQITVPDNPIQIADAALYLVEDASPSSASPTPTS